MDKYTSSLASALNGQYERNAPKGSAIAAQLIKFLPKPTNKHGWYYKNYEKVFEQAVFYYYTKFAAWKKRIHDADPTGYYGRLRIYLSMTPPPMGDPLSISEE